MEFGVFIDDNPFLHVELLSGGSGEPDPLELEEFHQLIESTTNLQLLCWSAIFDPLPGAFFHPFHTGPADLYRDDFVARRRNAFDACLECLEDGRYREVIWLLQWLLAC